MAVITEIAPNIFRISIFAPSGNLQFNHFLVKDDEPLALPYRAARNARGNSRGRLQAHQPFRVAPHQLQPF